MVCLSFYHLHNHSTHFTRQLTFTESFSISHPVVHWRLNTQGQFVVQCLAQGHVDRRSVSCFTSWFTGSNERKWISVNPDRFLLHVNPQMVERWVETHWSLLLPLLPESQAQAADMKWRHRPEVWVCVWVCVRLPCDNLVNPPVRVTVGSSSSSCLHIKKHQLCFSPTNSTCVYLYPDQSINTHVGVNPLLARPPPPPTHTHSGHHQGHWLADSAKLIAAKAKF